MRSTIARLYAAATSRASLAVMGAAAFVLVLVAIVPHTMSYG